MISLINTQDILYIIIRSFLSLVVLFLVTKMLGKKQLAQLTIYDYVVSITIGSIAADSIISLDEHFINGIVALFSFGFLALLVSYFSIKSEKANHFLNGEATILMEHGNFVFSNLKKCQIPIQTFLEQCRLKGYYDLEMINYAILETTGEISFLPKEKYQVTNTADFKKTPLSNAPKQTFQTNLIVDGSIQRKTLNDLGKDEAWLEKELKKEKVHDIKKVLLATVDEKGKLNIYKELI